jgi:hypothetical protein
MVREWTKGLCVESHYKGMPYFNARNTLFPYFTVRTGLTYFFGGNRHKKLGFSQLHEIPQI